MPELHTDLHEMPVVLWWKIQKADNALELIKGVKTSSKKILNQVNAHWYKLNNDFTDFFGVPKKQKKYLKLLAKHQMYVSAYARTKDHRWTTKRIYIEIELEAYNVGDETKNFNPYDELRNVSMTLDGAVMNPKEMSVIQYYSDKNLAIEKNKKAKQAQTKR